MNADEIEAGNEGLNYADLLSDEETEMLYEQIIRDRLIKIIVEIEG